MTVRKGCEKSKKFPKFSSFLKSIEYECKDKKETLDKLSHVSMILRMLDLPKPINDLMDSFGLGSVGDNEFANMVNELFDENVEMKKMDSEQVEEGTLIDYINRKYDKNISENLVEKNLEKKYIKIERNDNKPPNIAVIEKKPENNLINTNPKYVFVPRTYQGTKNIDLSKPVRSEDIAKNILNPYTRVSTFDYPSYNKLNANRNSVLKHQW